MKLRKFLINVQGSFVLESSVVLPVLFVSMLALLISGIMSLNDVIRYSEVTTAHERTAHSWTNSHRAYVSGIAPTHQFDPLYWRLQEGAAVLGLFGGRQNGIEPGGSLIKQKLEKAPAAIYFNPKLLHKQLETESITTLIPDATETIRTTLLTEYYLWKWQNRPELATTSSKQQAMSILGGKAHAP